MNEETPVETPLETPVETPVEIPVETPVETPVESVGVPGANFSSDYCPSEFDPGVMVGTLRQMVGTPSCGFEYLEYGFAAALFVILFALVASVFIGFSKLLGAR